jgi:hypothetical protein
VNKLQLDQALWACRLHNSVSILTLQYRVNVQREAIEALQLKEQEGSAANTSGFAASGRHNPIEIISVDDGSGGEFSPLTEGSGASVYTVLSSSRASSQSSQKSKTRKTVKQASAARLEKKLSKDDYDRRYKIAFKESTNLLANEEHLEPVQKMVGRLNELHNLDGKKKLTKSTVYRAVKAGMVGQSPLKKGPPSKIPDILLQVAATHSEVSQVGDGELKGRNIKRLIGASVLGTPYHGTFKVESAWKKLRSKFPQSVQAAKKMSVEDARAQWTTHDNLDQWFDDARRDLLQSGLVTDDVILNDNGTVHSELNFCSDDVL